jgi:hypothetical protein
VSELSNPIVSLAGQCAELTQQRDAARSIAVELEQELARVRERVSTLLRTPRGYPQWAAAWVALWRWARHGKPIT